MSGTFLQRIWNKWRNPRYFVGRDLDGNRYFEYPNPHGNWGRLKRMVKYRKDYDMWTYVAGDKRLPVQWSAWLTHTRSQAPTLEELHADIARQARVRMRAALIDAREQATPSVTAPFSQPRELATPPVPHSSVVLEQPSSTGMPPADRTPESSVSTGTHSHPLRSWPSGTPDEETQAWLPRISSRGGKSP